MQTEFSPPYRVWTSVTKEHFVINAKGGLEHGPFDSREDAQQWADSINAPLPLTSEADLIELRRVPRSAPTERTILLTSIGMLLMALGAATAIIVALTSLGG